MAKIYGNTHTHKYPLPCFRMSVVTVSTFYRSTVYVVSSNVFSTEKRLQERYDIKGSVVGRRASTSKKPTTSSSSTVSQSSNYLVPSVLWCRSKPDVSGHLIVLKNTRNVENEKRVVVFPRHKSRPSSFSANTQYIPVKIGRGHT